MRSRALIEFQSPEGDLGCATQAGITVNYHTVMEFCCDFSPPKGIWGVQLIYLAIRRVPAPAPGEVSVPRRGFGVCNHLRRVHLCRPV